MDGDLGDKMEEGPLSFSDILRVMERSDKDKDDTINNNNNRSTVSRSKGKGKARDYEEVERSPYDDEPNCLPTSSSSSSLQHSVHSSFIEDLYAKAKSSMQKTPQFSWDQIRSFLKDNADNTIIPSSSEMDILVPDFQDPLNAEFFVDEYDAVFDTGKFDVMDYEENANYQFAVPAKAVPTSRMEATRSKEWLLSQCEVHLALVDTVDMKPEMLCTDIFTILKSDKKDDGIQNALVDLLGYENFDFITTLVTDRREIVDTIMAEASQQQEFKQNTMDTKSVSPMPPPVPSRPQYGTGVTIQSEKEKQQLKQYRKEMKKKQKGISEYEESTNILGFDGDRLRQIREEQLSQNASAPLIQNPHATSSATEKYPNIYSNSVGGSTLSIYGTRYALPVGTERIEEQDYEEIIIPPSRVSPKVNNERLVPISELDEYAQRAFKNYKSLNRVQSIVYNIAYQTNENMLVCAPTGAGKTDIAMLTVLNTIQKFRRNGVLAKDEFKIVYVAPMKALAAEVVRKFSKRLGDPEERGGLGIAVRELTGDMQLTKAEIVATQMIVTTPEKWDVVTRKSVGDTELASKVKLLIIDEVHLLHDERGAVIESIVARTLRQVETQQSMIRIVGLSATLPNYVDVAAFLKVNPYQGLFFFDGGFRPVPLRQHLIGVKGKLPTSTTTTEDGENGGKSGGGGGNRGGGIVYKERLNRVCYEKVIELVNEGHQVMVFVHARKDTVRTGLALRELAAQENTLGLFDCSREPKYGLAVKDVAKSKNKELKELFASGFGIHHAGMLRSDRTLVERLFEEGSMKVLCCTATLAWGVNLPAYAVVIKGTQVYDASKGSFVDLSILDVLQIFGRAGRPQYEDMGVGYILTSADKLSHYVSSMTQQHPIESSFISQMTDNLNAEISLGTVTNVEEAITWLSYTFLYVRMRKNPFQYGIDWKEVHDDKVLYSRRQKLIDHAAKMLHKTQMIVYDAKTGYLTPKDLGRISSSFYIGYKSIEIFNEMMRPNMTHADVLSMVSLSSEFENIKVRDDELRELKGLERACICAIKGGTDTNHGKVNILLQGYISRLYVEDFALISDSAYVAQNAARILRAIFEITLNRNWGPTTAVTSSLCKSVDRRMWPFENVLKQFDLTLDIGDKLEKSKLTIEQAREMDSKEIGALIRHMKFGHTIQKCAEQFPMLQLETSIQPVTRNVLRVTLMITPDFVWNDRVHGGAEPWWIWVEDTEHAEILHSEYFLLTKRQADETVKIGFTIPIPQSASTVDELPTQIVVRAVSDKWIGAETTIPISFKHLILPHFHQAVHTDLLDLQPLPISALQNPILEEICGKRFQFFNPVQTQIFHTLYWTQHNALVGAPTGSGKTVAAELAMWSAFRDFPQSKVVYIAPLKALVRERVVDWRKRLAVPMGMKLVELTGDVTPDLKTIQSADIIITTPEKWDGISRSWQTRSYVTAVSLVIIDEIHLLGGDRGPILEVIVSRMKYIASQTDRQVRIVGLSTALANASDLADWLGIGEVGLFNFRHSVRPVPLEIYIDGFPGKHYCPRMQSMNKPTYAAIRTHSPTKPVIVFVSSRRQTRLTAQDLIALCANDDYPKRFLHMTDEETEEWTAGIKDVNLKFALQFGIGLHHAGLVESDRKVVEELFVTNKIQILIATSTLAWGVNYPAHLVVIKGTEFYDAKTRGYVDFPITDVLQMMGRAGRPQFDDSGVARVFVHDSKKNFYKKFLHEPFPVESSLHSCLHDHLNAEIVAGTVKSKQDAMDYLTWTYFYRRLQMNPTYYGVEDASAQGIEVYLSELIEKTLSDIVDAGCIEVEGDFYLVPTTFGRIASFYYLKYQTLGMLGDRITSDYQPSGNAEVGDRPDGDFAKILRILCDAPEYAELPVRHNEDLMNRELEKSLPIPLMEIWRPGGSEFGRATEVENNDGMTVSTGLPAYDSPHSKAFLLLQAHLSQFKALPCADYVTDTNSVLDQSVRILQAMVDVAADAGFLATSLGIMSVVQCLKQGQWLTESTLLTLPHLTNEMVSYLARGVNVNVGGGRKRSMIDCLPKLVSASLNHGELKSILSSIRGLSARQVDDIVNVVSGLPLYNYRCWFEGDGAVLDEKTGTWVLKSGKQYRLKMEWDRLTRTSRVANSRAEVMGHKAYCPRFPKPQTEGWWVVLGDVESDELIAMKRVSSSSNGKRNSSAPAYSGQNRKGSSVAIERDLSTNLLFHAPDLDGGAEENATLHLFFMSDAYIGMDMEWSVNVRIMK